MFIDRNVTQDPAPFGGAEDVLMSTQPLEFRSSERQGMGRDATYKHRTPNGVMIE